MSHKSVQFVNDIHCGSPTGLTPSPKNATQRAMLSMYRSVVKEWKHPDLLIANGDLVAGLAPADLDLDSTNIPDQAMDAFDLLMEWDAEEYMIVAGTKYHTGGPVSLEQFVAQQLRAAGKKVSYYHKLVLEINGWYRIVARHKIGRSELPHGRFTSPKRSMMWKVLNSALQALRTGKPLTWPHLCVFAHVHYYTYSEDDFGACVTLPCWQAPGSVFGDEQCDGLCSIGSFRVLVGKTEREGVICEKRLFPVQFRDVVQRR